MALMAHITAHNTMDHQMEQNKKLLKITVIQSKLFINGALALC